MSKEIIPKKPSPMCWVDKAQELVKNGDYNAKYKLLDTAIKSGLTGVLRYLIHECNINVEYCNEQGDAPIHTAAKFGNRIALAILEKEGRADINTINSKGDSALSIAIKENKLTTVQYLIRHTKIDTTFVDEEDNSLLHIAVMNEHLEILEYLIDAGNDDITLNRDGRNILHLAIDQGTGSIVRYLLQSTDFDVEQCTFPEGWSPIYIAVAEGKDYITQLVLRNERVNINAVNQYGENAFLVAVKEGNLKVIKYLKKYTNIDMNCCDAEGNNALHLAIICGHPEIFNDLILIKSLAAMIKHVTNYGWNLLHLAVYYDNPSIVKYLVETAGLSLDRRTFYDHLRPIDIAEKEGNIEILEYFIGRERHYYKSGERKLDTYSDVHLAEGGICSQDEGPAYEFSLIGDVKA